MMSEYHVRARVSHYPGVFLLLVARGEMILDSPMSGNENEIRLRARGFDLRFYGRFAEIRDHDIVSRAEGYSVRAVCVGEECDLHTVLLENAHGVVIIFALISADHEHVHRFPEFYGRLESRTALVEHVVVCDRNDVVAEIDEIATHVLRTVEGGVVAEIPALARHERFLIYKRYVRGGNDRCDLRIRRRKIVLPSAGLRDRSRLAHVSVVDYIVSATDEGKTLFLGFDFFCVG